MRDIANAANRLLNAGNDELEMIARRDPDMIRDVARKFVPAAQPNTTFAEEILAADAAPPEAIFDAAGKMLGWLNDDQPSKPSHVMCIGWQTIKRLAAGESVWFEDLQCGAVAADDLWGANIDRIIAGLDAPSPAATTLELAEDIAEQLGENYNRLPDEHFEPTFCKEDFRRAAESILSKFDVRRRS
jgi:hypothetical protein